MNTSKKISRGQRSAEKISSLMKIINQNFETGNLIRNGKFSQVQLIEKIQARSFCPLTEDVFYTSNEFFDQIKIEIKEVSDIYAWAVHNASFLIKSIDKCIKPRESEYIFLIKSDMQEPRINNVNTLRACIVGQYGLLFCNGFNFRVLIVHPRIIDFLTYLAADYGKYAPITAVVNSVLDIYSVEMLLDYKGLPTIDIHYKSCSYEEPLIPSLLMIGGVEPNPGPVIILPTLMCRLQLSEKTYHITFADKVTITVPVSSVTINEFEISVGIEDQTQYEQISSALYSSNVDKKALNIIQVKSTQEYYTPHDDFNPRMRIIIKPQTDTFEALQKTLPLEDSEGILAKVENFDFVPKNLLRFKIGKSKWLGGCDITPMRYRWALRIVEKQMMTKEQLVQYASLVTSCQMCHLNVNNEFADLFALFVEMFLINVKILAKNIRVVISEEESYGELLKSHVIVPTNVKFYGNVLELTKMNFYVPPELPTYSQFLEIQQTTPKYEFPSTKEEILRDFKTGRIRTATAKPTLLKFDFRLANPAISRNLRSETTDLTEFEKVVKKIVINRLTMHDFDAAVLSALATCENLEVIKQIVINVSERVFGNAVSVNLHNMIHDKKKQNMNHKDILSLPDGDIRYSDFEQEFKIARRLQLEYQIFCYELGQQTRANVFNTAKTIKHLVVLRYSKLEQTNESLLDKIKSSYLECKEFFKACGESKNTMTELNQLWKEKKTEVIDLLNLSHASSLGITLANSNFSSFYNMLSSCKEIANVMFDSLMNALMSLFGMEYTRTFNATTAILYYLIWKNTDNQVLRYMIMIDMLTEIGVVDVAISTLRSVGRLISNIWGSIVQVNDISDADFGEVLKMMKTEERISMQNAEEKLGNVENPDLTHEDISIFDKIAAILTSNNTFIIGSIVAIIGMAFKVKLPDNYDFSIIGRSVTETMRNLSILGGGLLAVPKIFQFLISAVKWIIDFIKSKVCKDHKTKLEINQMAESWLSKASVFVPDSVLRLLPKSPELCLTFVKLELELVELLKHTMRMERDLRITFDKISRIFISRTERVNLALTSMFPHDEIFHVQFYSAPGLGKTDLAHSVITELVAANTSHEIDRAYTIGGKITNAAITNAILRGTTKQSYYSMNENLNYMDGYLGQPVLYADDVNMFKTMDPENVIKYIYILSGNTMIANMADLSEKGRPIDSKIFVSNTNVPFPKPDGMYQPEALWRRRMLVRVKPKPELQQLLVTAQESTHNTIIGKFCIENGLNRTKSEHLIFDILNPTNETEKPIGVYVGDKIIHLQNLSITQLKAYISQAMCNHFATEWNRSAEKDPVMTKLKTYYSVIRDQVKDVEETNLLTQSEKVLNAYYGEYIQKNIEKCKEKHPELKEQYTELSKRYAVQKQAEIQFYKDYNTPVTREDIKLLIGAVECSGEARLCNFKLVKTEGSFNYYLAPCTTPRPYTHGEIDWNRVKKRKATTEGIVRHMYCYKADRELDVGMEALVVAALLELDAITPCHQENWLAKQKRRFNKEPILRNYKEELKCALTGLAHVLNSTRKLITKFVLEYVGKPLLIGVMSMIGMVGLFFSASMIGQLFAPTPTAYNARPVKTVIPGVRKPGEMSANTSEYKNLCRSEFKVYTQETNFTILAYTGNVFICNKHSFDNITFPAHLKIADPSVTSTMTECILMKHQFVIVPNCDVALIVLPEFRPTKSLRDKWITEAELVDDMINLRMLDGTVISIRERTMEFSSKASSDRDFLIQGPTQLYRPTNPEARGQHNSRVLAMKAQIQRGDSGSMVIHHSSHLPSRIVGLIHQSIQLQGEAFVAVVSREELDKAMKQVQFRDKISVNLSEFEEVSDHPYLPVFQHNQCIKVSPFPNQAISRACEFKKTPLFGVFPSEVEPAIQSVNDPRIRPGSRHFLEVSLNKAAGIKKAKFTVEQRKFGLSYLTAIYNTYHPDLCNARVLSTSQAIIGLPMKGYTSIDVTTCAGLPEKLEKGVVGKTPMIKFNAEENCWQIQNVVYQGVEFFEEMYIAGKVPQNFKLEFRKQELVPHSKIENPKTRTVGQGNYKHQIIYMKLFKDFHVIVKNTWNEGRTSPFALGIDPERHWHQVAEHLVYTDYVIDFDVKAWEEKVDQNLLYMSTEVKLKILKNAMLSQGLPWSEDYEKIAYALVVDYIHADVVFEDLVYEKSSGLLSGHPGTFMENSEDHEIIFGIVCYNILKKTAPQYATIQFIIEHCRSIKAADDILVAISPLARKFVNADSIVAEYKAIGYDLTAPDKSLNITPKTIHEVQFLKNGFLERDGHFYVYPNQSQIYQLLNWVRLGTKLSPEEQLRTNFGTAMRFAYWRGEEEYEEIRTKLNTLCARNKIRFVWNSTYDDMTSIIVRYIEDEENAYYSLRDYERLDL